MNILRKLLHRYVYQDWNIAIAEIGDDLTPVNIRWMKHNYKDRWFADPFIIDATETYFVILVEECMFATGRGRLARLKVSKDDFTLLANETILDIPTHLSFPNFINIEGQQYLYPENGQAGKTRFYKYGPALEEAGTLSGIPFADATIFAEGPYWYLLATVGEQCNGNTLQVYRSTQPLGGYTKIQDIVFNDNTARRAGNIFSHNGMLISPAQVCNNDYGEGVALQRLEVADGLVRLYEIKRMMPLSKAYPEGFHTYNVFGKNVVIDGYRYGSKLLHNLYFKLRS